MVDVLLLHRRYGAPTVFMAVERALAAGSYDFNAVALLARPAEEPRNTLGAAPHLHVLHNPDVPVPDCREYDQLLTER